MGGDAGLHGVALPVDDVGARADRAGCRADLVDPVEQTHRGGDLLLSGLQSLDVATRRRGQRADAHELGDGAQQVAVVGCRVVGEDDPPRAEHADRLPLVLRSAADDPEGRGRVAVALGLVKVVVPDASVARVVHLDHDAGLPSGHGEDAVALLAALDGASDATHVGVLVAESGLGAECRSPGPRCPNWCSADPLN